jgi:hypothetical protein
MSSLARQGPNIVVEQPLQREGSLETKTFSKVPAVFAGHVLKEAASVKLCFGTAFTASKELVEKAEEFGERFSTSLTLLY